MEGSFFDGANFAFDLGPTSERKSAQRASARSFSFWSLLDEVPLLTESSEVLQRWSLRLHNNKVKAVYAQPETSPQ